MTIDTTLLNLDLPTVVLAPDLPLKEKEDRLSQALAPLVEQKRKLDYHLRLLTAASEFLEERIDGLQETWQELHEKPAEKTESEFAYGQVGGLTINGEQIPPSARVEVVGFETIYEPLPFDTASEQYKQMWTWISKMHRLGENDYEELETKWMQAYYRPVYVQKRIPKN